MLSNPNILTLSNDAPFLEMINQLAKSHGYRCEISPDINAFSERAHTNSHDLILVDVDPPASPVVDIIKRVHEKKQGLPVIIVTRNLAVSADILLANARVRSFHLKPVDPEALAQSVSSALSYRKVYLVVHQLRVEIEEAHKRFQILEQCAGDEATLPGQLDADEIMAIVRHAASDAMAKLHHVANSAAEYGIPLTAYGVAPCPHIDHVFRIVRHTIDVLKETKGAFKSKALAELRKDLETLVTGQSGLSASCTKLFEGSADK